MGRTMFQEKGIHTCKVPEEGSNSKCLASCSLRPASRVCDLCLTWILCCCHFEILNNFIFELMFCRWSPMGQESMCRSCEDRMVAWDTCTCLKTVWSATSPNWLWTKLGPTSSSSRTYHHGKSLACSWPNPGPKIPTQTITFQSKHWQELKE